MSNSHLRTLRLRVLRLIPNTQLVCKRAMIPTQAQLATKLTQFPLDYTSIKMNTSLTVLNHTPRNSRVPAKDYLMGENRVR